MVGWYSSVDLAPLARIARLAAIIPPPRRHVVRYSGVISSHSSLRSQVVPVHAVAAPEENDKPSLPLSHYISWSQLLKKTFEIDTVCPVSRVREHLVRTQKPGQARCADAIGAALMRSGRVPRRSKTPFDSPMVPALVLG